MPDDSLDQLRAALATLPSAPPADDSVDRLRSALRLTGPAERAQVDADQERRRLQDALRAAGHPIQTAPLMPIAAGLDHGWTIQDTHALREYGIKVDPTTNADKRNSFIKHSFVPSLMAGEQLPGVFQITTEDDPLHGTMLQVMGDPTKGPALQNKLIAWGGTMYNLQHQAPSGDETLQAVRDGVSQWLRAGVTREGGNPADYSPKELGAAVNGAELRPAWTPAQLRLPPGTTEADIQNLYAKYQGTGTNYFTPEERTLFDSVRGRDLFRFLDSRTPYFVTRNRLEKVLGRQIEDRTKPPPVNVDQSNPLNDPITQPPLTDPLNGRAEYPLRIEQLADKDADLSFLTQVSRARQQGQAEAARFAATHTVPINLPVALPGYHEGQWSLRSALVDMGNVLEATMRNPLGGLMEVRKLETLQLGSVNMATAMESPKVADQLWDLGMKAGLGALALAHPIAAGLLYFSPEITGGGFHGLDLATQLFTQQQGQFSAGAAKLLGYLTRGIAPHLGQDAANTAEFANRLLDQLPADTPAEDIQDLVKLIPAAASFGQIIDAGLKSNVPILNWAANEIRANPFLEEQLGGIAASTDRPAEFAALALGFTAVPGFLYNKAKLAGVPNVLTRYTKYDFVSATEQAAELARGQLINLVDKSVRRLRNPDDARVLLDRTTDMLRTEGGALTAEDAGVLLHQLDKIKRVSDAIGDAPIRQETREAILGAVRPVIDVGPTEAIYAATGKKVPLGAGESERINAKLDQALTRVQTGGEASPILNFIRDDKFIRSAVEAVHKKIERDREGVNRKQRWLDFLSDGADAIVKRGEARDAQVASASNGRDRIVRSTNDEVQQSLANSTHYDLNGGVRYHEIRPGVRQPIDIAPNADPKRAEIRQRIADKLEAARKNNELVRLDNAEESLLNGHRNTPLDLKLARKSYDALGDDFKKNKAESADDARSIARLSDFAERIRAIDPTVPGRPIQVPAAVSDILTKEFKSKALDLTSEKFQSIHPGYPADTLNHLEALNELTGRIRADLAPAAGDLRRLSEFHSRILINSGNRGDYIWALNRSMRDGGDFQRFWLTEATRAAKLMGRENIPLDELMQAMQDASQGKATSPLAVGIMRRIREGLGKGLIDVGIVDRATAQKWIDDPTYYHGVLDPEDISRLPPAIHHPLGNWTRLGVRGDYMKAAIPETAGEYHVVYKEGNQVRFKEGFKSPAEAKAWLDSGAGGLDPTTAVDIRKNLPFAEKVLRGIIGDPTISFLELTKKLTGDIARARLNRDLSRTPYVKSDAEAGIDQFKITDNTATDLNGKKWFRVTSPKALHLYGKWVHEAAIDMLRLHDYGFEWFKEVTDGLQSGTGIWDMRPKFLGGKGANPLMNHADEIMTRIMGTGGKEPSFLTKLLIRTPNNILAWSRVATSPLSLAGQIPANWLLNLPAIGLDTLHVGNFGFILDAASEFLKGGEAGTLPRALDLERNGNIRRSKAAFYAELNDIVDKYRGGIKELTGRMEFHRAQAGEHEINGNFDEANAHYQKASDIEAKLRAIEPKAAGGFIRDFAGLAYKVMAEIGKSAFLGRGALNDTLWDVFALPDNIAKYAAHKFLVEKKGLSVEDSLSRIDTFGQNLHFTPSYIKGLANQMGGGLFLSYRANALKTALNTLYYRPWFTLSRLGLLVGWNRAMLQLGGDDPEDSLNRWSFTNWGTRNNFLTESAFLGSRILFPGGRGGLTLGNTFTDLFAARSQMGRNIQNLILKQPESFYSKAPKLLLNGLVSQFYGSLPSMNIAADWIKGTDQNGRPFKDVSDFFTSELRNFLPAALVDTYEMGARAAGYKWDNYSARQKDWMDYLRHRLGFMNPSDVGDEALLRAAIQHVVSGTRGLGKWLSENNDDSLRQIFLANGVYDARDIASAQKRTELTKTFLESKGKVFPDVDGSRRPAPLTSEAIQAALRGGHLPGTYADMHRLTLAEQLLVYAHVRTASPKGRDPSVDQMLRRIIVERATNPSAHGDKQAIVETQRAILNLRDANGTYVVPDATRKLINYAANEAVKRIDEAANRRK